MICVFRQDDRATPRRDGLQVWIHELLVPARVFDLYCPARLHCMSIGPIHFLDEQEGLSLYSREPIRISLGQPAGAGMLVRLDLSMPNEGDPPFMVAQFPRQRQPPWQRRARRRSRRVVVIK